MHFLVHPPLSDIDFYTGLEKLKERVAKSQPSLLRKCINFITKLLSDHLKGTKKFGSKVINGQLFHRKTVFCMKILSI